MRLDRSLQAQRSARTRSAPHPHATLDAALISGGDSRLAIDAASRMNAYGTQPSPRPDEISLSSSTATTVSVAGHAAARAAFARLEEARARGPFASAYVQLADELRGAIRAEFDLAGAEAVSSPSGTDSALLALFLARGLLGRPVTSIVVAADESGNGASAAASGRHFSVLASSGRTVVKGEPIAGLACAAIAVAARDAHGRARPLAEIDAEVASAAEAAIRAGNGVVLFAMDHSKLGSRGPSLDCLREVCALAPESVQVVVDACQARLSRARLAWYLAKDFLILVTGSKFFTGPPLSGALLVSESLLARAGRIADVPTGLADYTARDDWPAAFDRIRDRLPARANVGQALRWVAAIEDIHAYFATPELFRRLALAAFAAAVPRHIARFSELTLLPESAPLIAEAESDEFAARSIFPFTVTHNGRALSLAETRVLHRALNADLVALGLGRNSIAAVPCHIGQPVALADGAGGTGALRISADARLIADSWAGAGDLVSTTRLTERLDQIAIVFEKLRFLLPHLERLEGLVPPTAA